MATLIKTGLHYKIIPAPDDTECIIVEIQIQNAVYTIANLYIPPNTIIKKDDLHEIFKLNNLILTGDMNSHHPMWGTSSPMNQRGEIIEKLIEENQLVLLNSGEGTFQRNDGTMSVLDLTIVHHLLANKCSWEP